MAFRMMQDDLMANLSWAAKMHPHLVEPVDVLFYAMVARVKPYASRFRPSLPHLYPASEPFPYVCRFGGGRKG